MKIYRIECLKTSKIIDTYTNFKDAKVHITKTPTTKIVCIKNQIFFKYQMICIASTEKNKFKRFPMNFNLRIY